MLRNIRNGELETRKLRELHIAYVAGRLRFEDLLDDLQDGDMANSASIEKMLSDYTLTQRRQASTEFT